MTQEERNKQIIQMLGFKRGVYYDKDLKFHSDWNWLMEAVEFIEKILYNNQPIHFGRNVCVIFSPKTIKSKGKDKKEAVFIAVSDFAKLYNENKL